MLGQPSSCLLVDQIPNGRDSLEDRVNREVEKQLIVSTGGKPDEVYEPI